MRSKRSLAWIAAVAVAMTTMVVMPAAQAATLKGSFRGNAYGTRANAKVSDGIRASLGRSGYIVCPCNGTHGKTRVNRVASVKAFGPGGKALTAHVIKNTVWTRKSNHRTAKVRNTSKVAKLRMLTSGGNSLIKAAAVKAVARARANPKSIHTSIRGSSFLRLRVAGTLVTNISPGKHVRVPGIGHLVLKRVHRERNDNFSKSISVDMLTLVVTKVGGAPFGLPVGAKVIVGHATAGYVRSQPKTIVGGQAYAAQAKTSALGIQAQVGRLAAIYMGCTGTHGRIHRNKVTTAGVDPLLGAGVGKTTAFGGKVRGGAKAITTAKLANLKLLNSPIGYLITADAVKGVARSKYAFGKGHASTRGSFLLNLKIGSTTYPAHFHGKVILPGGIGYVKVREVHKSVTPRSASIGVNMLHVHLSVATLGLPAGTDIIISHAKSSARRF